MNVLHPTVYFLFLPLRFQCKGCQNNYICKHFSVFFKKTGFLKKKTGEMVKR